MRRGSLSERTIKCSEPGCACAHDPKARHGPYYSLTHAVGGKTHSRFLTVEQAELVRQQIEAGRQFRGRVDAWWEASEQWADRELANVAASSEGPKKGLQANLQDEIAQEIESLLGRQAVADLDFEAVEMGAWRQALRLAARSLEQRLNADTSDHAGPELACAYGELATPGADDDGDDSSGRTGRPPHIPKEHERDNSCDHGRLLAIPQKGHCQAPEGLSEHAPPPLLRRARPLRL